MKKWLLMILPFISVAASAQNDVTTNATVSASEKVFRTPDVDSKPQLKNGINELSVFIGNNYKFPQMKNKQIKIFVSFIVEPNGSTSDVKAFYVNIKDLVSNTDDQVKIETEAQKELNAEQSNLLKKEAVRVITAFNEKWIPAKKDGQIVRCLYNYPINFNLE